MPVRSGQPAHRHAHAHQLLCTVMISGTCGWLWLLPCHSLTEVWTFFIAFDLSGNTHIPIQFHLCITILYWTNLSLHASEYFNPTLQCLFKVFLSGTRCICQYAHSMFFNERIKTHPHIAHAWNIIHNWKSNVFTQSENWASVYLFRYIMWIKHALIYLTISVHAWPLGDN